DDRYVGQVARIRGERGCEERERAGQRSGRGAPERERRRLPAPRRGRRRRRCAAKRQRSAVHATILTYPYGYETDAMPRANEAAPEREARGAASSVYRPVPSAGAGDD